MKGVAILFVAMMVGGCVSASTSAKLCSDLTVIDKTVSAISAGAGQAIAEYTPKKCVSAGVSADSGKLTGGVTAGVSNE